MAFLGSATRDYRFGLMREMMDREGYDALAFTQGDFFQFATNFHTDVQTWERPILCVVPRNGEPFAILNELSTNHWRFALEAQHLWVTDAHFYAEHPRLHARAPLATQWVELVADKLGDAGLRRARIGADAGGGPLARVASILPHLRIETATKECRHLRLVKNEEEIALMREIASLSD
jgi:Xaa-Pro aminopeptidase